MNVHEHLCVIVQECVRVPEGGEGEGSEARGAGGGVNCQQTGG